MQDSFENVFFFFLCALPFKHLGSVRMFLKEISYGPRGILLFDQKTATINIVKYYYKKL